MPDKLKTYLGDKTRLATALAILFHLVGLIGILYFDRAFFSALTPWNLLLMFALMLYTQADKEIGFFVFMIICIIVGLSSEWIGVNTGRLFGNYSYGQVLGWQLFNVPLIIGINWFITIYGCGILMNAMLEKISTLNGITSGARTLSLIIDGATMAVLFDWLMEPVAVKLSFWSWLGNGEIPWFNYLCWFLISAILMIAFRYFKFNKNNKFVMNLLLIQAMFFLLLRTFL